MGSFCRFPGDLPEKPRKVSFTEYLRTMKLGGKACTLRGECKFQPVLFNNWYLCLVHSTRQFQKWRKSQDVVFKIIKAMSNVLPDTSARRNTFLKLRVKISSYCHVAVYPWYKNQNCLERVFINYLQTFSKRDQPDQGEGKELLLLTKSFIDPLVQAKLNFL